MMKRKMLPVMILPLLLTAACKAQAPESSTGEPAEKRAPLPVVTDARTDLILSWYVDGGPEMGSSVSEVPDGARKEVRVQDPTIPPEALDPEVIYIADLTEKQGETYPVRAVDRAAFESRRQAERERLQKEKSEAAAAAGVSPGGGDAVSPPPVLSLPPGAAPSVVMYATKHCPVCVKARRWLLEQKIPYIEKDLERDPSAAARLQQLGRAQGVPTNGVPVFEINGRLLPGFDPAQIVALLMQGSGRQETI